MPISMYQASVPPIKKMLSNLDHILTLAQTHAEAKKIDPSVLVQVRLFPDMLPLVKQVQIATDQAKGGCARLAGLPPPSYEDNETTIQELRDRITKTISFLDSIKPEQIDGSEEREIKFMVRDHQFEFLGSNYLTTWILPNFFFHVTTAYNLLRHNGVEIGKRDFLGQI